MSTLIRVFDVETTGLPADDKITAIIQAGWTDLTVTADEIIVSEPVQFLCDPRLGNPSIKIETGAKATHHIQEDDLDGAPAVETILRKMTDGADYFACHNKEHDGHYFTGGGKPMICTLKAAQNMWPDVERFGNQFLRYALDLRADGLDRDKAEPSHHAGPDSYVTAFLLRRMLVEGADIDQLLEWTAAPVLQKMCRFGNKYRGLPWSEVPTDYLIWMRDKATDLDRDTKHTMRTHLKQRGVGR